jgi:hypothetical protein
MTSRVPLAAALALVLAGCGAPRPAASHDARLVDAGAGGATATAVSGPPLSAERLLADARWLCDPARAGRGSYQPAALATADWIEAAFRDAGLEVSRQPIHDGAVNIIGIRRGAASAGDHDAAAKAVVVSAHYDHLGVTDEGVVYPGADDNASGTAVLLALARHGAGRPLRHSVIFIAFGAEETGLEGSAAYVNAPPWPLADTLAVINFDMVGRNFFELGSGKEATAAAVADDLALFADAERAAVAAGLELVRAPPRALVIFGSDFRTDEWMFRRHGVRAIHFSTGLHEDYHQPTDTVDRLVPAQMARVAATAAGLIETLANPTPAAPGAR